MTAQLLSLALFALILLLWLGFRLTTVLLSLILRHCKHVTDILRRLNDINASARGARSRARYLRRKL